MSIYDTRSTFDNATNLGISMAAIGFALVAVSDNYRNKVFMRVIGLLCVVTGGALGFMTSLDYIYFMLHIKNRDVPVHMSIYRLWAHVILCYTFSAFLGVLGVYFVYVKLVKHQKF